MITGSFLNVYRISRGVLCFDLRIAITFSPVFLEINIKGLLVYLPLPLDFLPGEPCNSLPGKYLGPRVSRPGLSILRASLPGTALFPSRSPPVIFKAKTLSRTPSIEKLCGQSRFSARTAFIEFLDHRVRMLKYWSSLFRSLSLAKNARLVNVCAVTNGICFSAMRLMSPVSSTAFVVILKFILEIYHQTKKSSHYRSYFKSKVHYSPVFWFVMREWLNHADNSLSLRKLQKLQKKQYIYKNIYKKNKKYI